MRKTLSDRVALVTGSSRGIGRATAQALARRGARLVLNARDAARLERARAELAAAGCEVAAAAGDVADPAACRRVVEAAAARWGRLDILVNNAGTSARGRFLATEPEVFRQVITSNLLGPMYATRLALPYLQRNGGSAVFVSSLTGLHGIPGGAAYGAAKMALTALAQALRAESDGVHFGVLYVPFTRNDPDKQLFHPDGSLAPIRRPYRYTHTPDMVGEAIARLIERRRGTRVLGSLGWTITALCRLSPRLLQALVGIAGRRLDPLGE